MNFAGVPIDTVSPRLMTASIIYLTPDGYKESGFLMNALSKGTVVESFIKDARNFPKHGKIMSVYMRGNVEGVMYQVPLHFYLADLLQTFYKQEIHLFVIMKN